MRRLLLAIGAAVIAAVLSQCQAGPTPTPIPTCDACALATRVEELSRWLTPSPQPSASPSSTMTPTATMLSPTPSPTASRTPSRTPSATETLEREPLTVTLQGIAKAGSYSTLVFDFSGDFVASIGLEGREGTSFYNRIGDSAPPVNCSRLSGLCWEVSGQFRGTASLYFLSTWKPGDVVQLTAWILRQEELLRIPLKPIVIGGGAFVPTATPAPTPTRTPGAAQVWQGGQWTQIAGSGAGPDLVYLLQPGIEDVRVQFCDAGFKCCADWDVVGAAWGMMIQRLACGCAEPRWVFAPATMTVERVRWEGVWGKCSGPS